MGSSLDEESELLELLELAEGQAQLTDSTNAEKMVQLFGNKLHYCPAWKKWLVWNGEKWQVDHLGRIYQYAKKTIRWYYQQAMDIPEKSLREKLKKHALRSESASKLEALIRLAKTEEKIPLDPEEMDKDPWLFNVKNGTLNLKTGELLPFQTKKLITKQSPILYKPEVACPTWEHFLKSIFPKEEMIAFLRKAVGWSLTGSMREQVLFILYGSGANGKSTFLNTLGILMGDYGANTPSQTLMSSRNEQSSNDIARLQGTRFVTAIETGQGRSMAENLIKQLTGTDKLTARFLYGEFFEFAPTFKIFMATNHKPIIKGTDHAIWRRIRLVPFEVSIPEEKQDKELAEKLEMEMPGILNWALQGCMEWQQEGLGYPQAVKNATEGYRSEMDVISSFIEQNCQLGEDKMNGCRPFYKIYRQWCEETGEYTMSERVFNRRMDEKGYDRVRRTNGYYWIGVEAEVY